MKSNLAVVTLVDRTRSLASLFALDTVTLSSVLRLAVRNGHNEVFANEAPWWTFQCCLSRESSLHARGRRGVEVALSQKLVSELCQEGRVAQRSELLVLAALFVNEESITDSCVYEPPKHGVPPFERSESCGVVTSQLNCYVNAVHGRVVVVDHVEFAQLNLH